MKDTVLALASDHAGLALKNHIKAYLEAKGYTCEDVGTSSDARTDTAPFAALACQAVLEGRCRFALLFCGTGIGMCIAANKHPGIRACACSDVFTAGMTRMHNDANALCIGARVVGVGVAETLVDAFLAAEFLGENDAVYQRRIEQITDIERRYGAKV